MHDAHLITQVMQGDQDAFDALEKQYRAKLTSFCRRYFLEEGDVEDATQETFLRAWKSRASFRADSSYATWLYKIATNVCLDLLQERRKIRRADLYDDEGDPVVDPSDPTPTPEQLAIWQAMRTAILTRAKQVKPPWEEPTDYLIYYYHCEREESFRQISERLGMGEPAVKQRYARKIEPLLHKIEQEFR